MPAFYSRQMANQMPLTPPDSGSGYAYSTMHYPHDPYTAHQSLSQSRHDTSYDYQQSYMPSTQPPSTYQQYPQNSYPPANSLPPLQSFYEPMGAPILPPLRIQDRGPFTEDINRRVQQEQQSAAAREQQRQTAKEEKATGGVSAKLDYDMEQMTDFVVDAAQSIFQYSMQSQPSFRKWVHQVLSATRLPSATILLSLHYLNHRIEHHPESVTPGENQIYRLLAVSLILGSKFLDDNTFINKSWSDVTAIKVNELNVLEIEWLKLIKYNLHVDPKSPNGLQNWLDTWADYKSRCAAKQQQAARLSPLNTNVYRHSPRSDRFSPPGYPSPYSAATSRSYETPLTSRSTYGTTPYQASDPWASTERYNIDDFYKRQHRYPTLTELDDVNRRASEERARQSAYAYSQNGHSSFYQAPYSSGWDQHAWNGMHRYDCGCSSCAFHYRPYSMASGYTAQTVMG